jgi:hypothetical protein
MSVKMKTLALKKEEKLQEVKQLKEQLLRLVTKVGARPKMEVPMYEGNLNVEEFLDWINAMDKYFDYEDIDEEKKVKHVVTRLKGHATLWWDELQADRRRKERKNQELGQDGG